MSLAGSGATGLTLEPSQAQNRTCGHDLTRCPHPSTGHLDHFLIFGMINNLKIKILTGNSLFRILKTRIKGQKGSLVFFSNAYSIRYFRSPIQVLTRPNLA